jgi:hypothetical protein
MMGEEERKQGEGDKMRAGQGRRGSKKKETR